MKRRCWLGVGLFTVCMLWNATAAAQGFPELEPEPLVPVEPEPVPSRTGADSGAPLGDAVRHVFAAEGGLSLLQRSYTLDSKDTSLEFSSALYPSVYLEAEAFPLKGKEYLEDLGVMGEFKRGLDNVVINEAGVERKVPVRHSEISLSLAYRYLLDPAVWLRGEVGFTALDFVLSRNPFYSNTTYRALRLAARGEYRWLPWLTAFGDLNLFPVVGLGASEAEFGTGSSTFGAGVALGAMIDVVEGLYLRTGYMIRFFNTTFEGTGERELESVVTTDIFHDLTLWMGYRL